MTYFSKASLADDTVELEVTLVNILALFNGDCLVRAVAHFNFELNSIKDY